MAACRLGGGGGDGFEEELGLPKDGLDVLLLVEHHLGLCPKPCCVCVCVRVCARACACERACVCV